MSGIYISLVSLTHLSGFHRYISGLDHNALRQQLPPPLGRDESLLCLEDSGQSSDIQSFSPTSLSSIASQPEAPPGQEQRGFGTEGASSEREKEASEDSSRLGLPAYPLDDESHDIIQRIAADYAAQAFYSGAAKQAARLSIVPTSDTEEEYETGGQPSTQRSTRWDGFMSSWSSPSSQESDSAKALSKIPSRLDPSHPGASHKQKQKHQTTLSFNTVVRGSTTLPPKAAMASLKRHASEDTRTRSQSKSKSRVRRTRK